MEGSLMEEVSKMEEEPVCDPLLTSKDGGRASHRDEGGPWLPAVGQARCQWAQAWLCTCNRLLSGSWGVLTPAFRTSE